MGRKSYFLEGGDMEKVSLVDQALRAKKGQQDSDRAIVSKNRSNSKNNSYFLEYLEY